MRWRPLFVGAGTCMRAFFFAYLSGSLSRPDNALRMYACLPACLIARVRELWDCAENLLLPISTRRRPHSPPLSPPLLPPTARPVRARDHDSAFHPKPPVLSNPSPALPYIYPCQQGTVRHTPVTLRHIYNCAVLPTSSESVAFCFCFWFLVFGSRP